MWDYFFRFLMTSVLGFKGNNRLEHTFELFINSTLFCQNGSIMCHAHILLTYSMMLVISEEPNEW